MAQTDDKKKQTPAPKGPNKAAIDALKKVVADSAKANEKNKKSDEPPPPESLPENAGVGDYVRVGASRLKRAIFGPPAPPPKKQQ